MERAFGDHRAQHSSCSTRPRTHRFLCEALTGQQGTCDRRCAGLRVRVERGDGRLSAEARRPRPQRALGRYHRRQGHPSGRHGGGQSRPMECGDGRVHARDELRPRAGVLGGHERQRRHARDRAPVQDGDHLGGGDRADDPANGLRRRREARRPLGRLHAARHWRWPVLHPVGRAERPEDPDFRQRRSAQALRGQGLARDGRPDRQVLRLAAAAPKGGVLLVQDGHVGVRACRGRRLRAFARAAALRLLQQWPHAASARGAKGQHTGATSAVQPAQPAGGERRPVHGLYRTARARSRAQEQQRIGRRAPLRARAQKPAEPPHASGDLALGRPPRHRLNGQALPRRHAEAACKPWH
mmetsp:Transcript_28262/g.66070  ORF Transcript_28262/g.66070 Transcript_28262/m.66070 type:complete len:355 (-) Transcript_28262:594-1658(-)